MDDTIYREAAVKHLKHRLYETATNNPDIAGVFSEIADNRVETWIEELPSAHPETEKRTAKSEQNISDSDLISRKAAIDEIKALYEWHDTVTEDRTSDHLKRLPSAQPEPRWIPVTERLPEEGVMVLVTCYGRDMIIMRDGESLEDAIERVRKEVVNVTIGLVGSDGWYGADYSPMIITPVAWMPLPEPYTEEE